MQKHLLQPARYIESQDVSHPAQVLVIDDKGKADITVFKVSGNEFLKGVPIATDNKTVGCWQPE